MRLKRKLKDFCVYFPPGETQPDGTREYGDPVERRCRWEDTQEQKMDRAGDMWLSKSSIDLDENVEELGILWHGRFAELTSTTEPTENPGASEIRRVDRVTSRKADQTLYTAWL
jgi:hypothetical protein